MNKLGTDCCGQPIEHNTNKWEVRTNRHTTTSGHSWGWIEGCDKNIVWSNDSNFNKYSAHAVVKAHNEWLESQKPIDLKIIEESKKLQNLQEAFSDLEEHFELIQGQIKSKALEIEKLKRERS